MYADSEIGYIKANWGIMTTKEIGRKLNRSAPAVYAKAVTLGLTKKTQKPEGQPISINKSF